MRRVRHPYRVPSFRVTVVRWVGDEPQPGWVEAQFTDAAGETWTFFDKPPIFEPPGTMPLTASTAYPVEIAMPVLIHSSRPTDAGRVVTISLPWGVDYDSAQDRFEVYSHDLVDDPPDDTWMPDGWDEWSPKRRRLWRRERQAERMAALDVEDERARLSRDRWVDHLRAEAADLQRELAAEDEDGVVN